MDTLTISVKCVYYENKHARRTNFDRAEYELIHPENSLEKRELKDKQKRKDLRAK